MLERACFVVVVLLRVRAAQCLPGRERLLLGPGAGRGLGLLRQQRVKAHLLQPAEGSMLV